MRSKSLLEAALIAIALVACANLLLGFLSVTGRIEFISGVYLVRSALVLGGLLVVLSKFGRVVNLAPIEPQKAFSKVTTCYKFCHGELQVYVLCQGWCRDGKWDILVNSGPRPPDPKVARVDLTLYPGRLTAELLEGDLRINFGEDNARKVLPQVLDSARRADIELTV